MKIGIDVRCFARGKVTGIEGYTKNFLISIFESDTQNEYHLFFNAWKGQAVDFSWIDVYPHVFIHMYRIPNKLLNVSLWFLHYPKIDRLCGDVDVFFMPNANFCAVSVGVPLILTVHDLSFEHYARSFSLRMRVWHFFVNVRLLIKNATYIIAVSEATKVDIIHTYKVDHNKIAVAHNGRTIMSGKIDRNSIAVITVKERYQLPYQFILFFGTIEPRKNIVSIVHAYESFRRAHPALPYKLVIAGARGWCMEQISDEIAHMTYRDDIIVITDVPEDDKESLFILASVLVYPSFFEGFGFPPLEALMCGTPVITSHVSSLPEVVGKYAIMIDPCRTEEIAHALMQVLLDRELRSHFTLDEHAMHIRRFTWMRAAAVFHDVVRCVFDASVQREGDWRKMNDIQLEDK